MMHRILAVAAAVLLAAIPLPAAAAPDSDAQCQKHTVAVSLHAGAPRDQHIAGWLCSRGPATGKTVQLLVPGYTYDHTYWDFGHQPQRYSYARHAIAAGYATFAIDRIGTGASSKPPATDVSVPVHAWTVHQTVGALREGGVAGTAFPKVVLVGHSLGAAVAQTEASRYRDVDAVVLSDWMHTPYWYGTPGVIVASTPAQLDPRFTTRPLGYTTTVPASRRLLFHSGSSDPAVIAHDEATKQTGTVLEEATIVPTVLPSLTRGITVPVLLATGQHDAIFCGPLTPCPDPDTVHRREAANFAPEACLRVFVLPDAGHSINLAPNARTWFAAAQGWVDRVQGRRAPEPAPGCTGLAPR